MEVLQRTANRGSISTGYDIDNSVKLERDNAEGFNFTNSGAGNRKTWTISYWFKRTELGGGYDIIAGANTGLEIGFDPNNRFQVYDGGYLFVTNRVFRDTSAFYHIVVQLDTTQSTASNRIKLYVNGVEETSLATDSPPSQNADLKWNNTGLIFYVGYYPSTNYYSNGYLADVYSIDGQVVAPTEFGEFDEDTGIWKPIKYTGSYGTNGFKLEFKDSSALNTDTSGSSKSISLNNVTAADQAIDTPTNNFCTMNHNARTNGNIRTQEGGTYVTTDGGSGWCSMLGSMAVGAGKWYWEALYYNNSDADDVHIGVAPTNDRFVPHNQTGYYLGNVETGGSMGWDLDGGANYNQNGSWGNPSRGDKLMVALDMDNYKLYYGINGTWGNSANPANGTGSVTSLSSYWMSGITGALDFVMPGVSVYQGNYMKGFNFGGYCAWTIASAATDANGYGTFEYAPPSGFYALCTKNLAQYG